MSDIRLDHNHDIYINGGNLELVSDVDETVQLIKQTLKFFKGEWFLDETLGIPYFELMEKPINIELIKSVLIATIAKIPNVLAIEKFELDYLGTTRQLNINFTLKVGNNIISMNEVI
jgi:hypothetical protein